MLNLYTEPDGKKLCRFPLSSIWAMKAAFLTGQVQGLFISMGGLTRDQFTELSKFVDVEILILIDCRRDMSFDFLKSMPKLKKLTINGVSPNIDFAFLPNLEQLSLTWRDNLFLNAGQSNLKVISIERYSEPKFETLSTFRNLTSLCITQSKMVSLEGLENVKELHELHLLIMKNLADITAVSKLNHLKKFRIENSKKIESYEPLSFCGELAELMIHDCSPIGSLKFIENLKCLKSFRFINTDVLDGDLTALLKLEDVCFTPRRHFSHKLSDFKQKLKY